MSATVLVVDDSLTVRMDLAEAFEGAGFRCIPCATIADARQALASRAVDLAVLDVVLTDGDGIELLAEIRAGPGTTGLPVIMLSTVAEVRDRIRGLRTGADEYVGKPYEASYLVSRARELLHGRGAAARPVAATVLVIDDSPTFREELRSALESAGYTVLDAATGEEGLRRAADHRPDAIMVDGVLPGVDGATVIRRVRLDAALRDTPCVLMTASEDHGAELRALDAGADAFLRKGEDLDVILARLGAALRAAVSGIGRERAASLLGPKKILAVDDSPTYLHELGDALRSEGYDVVLAHSGEEALELLAVQPVDCILLDLLMPGIGGTETCRRIKSAPVVREIPLIILTALEDRAAMVESLGAGADDYISKSSDHEVLKARVRAQIRRKQSEDENRRIRDQLLRKEIEATEARAARELAEARAALVGELERKNRELEAFSYSVSHDLRAPLRAIDGFGRMLAEDCGERLDDEGRGHLRKIEAAVRRMSELIDDLLALSRIERADLRRVRVDLSQLARHVGAELATKEPERRVALELDEALVTEADPRLMRVALENLFGNAWKFTARTPAARIEFRAQGQPGNVVYRVQDNGAGFDMRYAGRLFGVFQRLHSEAEFPGTGIGLATVQRIIERHGGRVWAESEPGGGATFYFTLGAAGRDFKPF